MAGAVCRPCSPQHLLKRRPRGPLCYTAGKGDCTLEGHRRIHSGRSLVGLMCAGAIFSLRRIASTLLLALFLLVPYGSAFYQLQAADDATCGMPCCKRSKVCCCRKQARSVNPAGPVWIASPKCSAGCAQLPATQRSSAASLDAAGLEAVPVVVAARILLSSLPQHRSIDSSFALFERPPPRSA